MTATDGENRKRLAPRTHVIVSATIAWSLVLFLVLCWQALHYEGLMAWAGEWEFNHLGAYYPVLSVLCLTILLASPLILLVLYRSWPSRTRSILLAEPAAVADRARRAANDCWIAAAILAIAAAGVFGYGRFGIVETRRPALVNPAVPASLTSGRVQMHGTVMTERLAVVEQNGLFYRRTLQLAPVLPAAAGSTAAGQELRVFAVVAGAQDQPKAGAPLNGYLVQGGLPAGATQLFRDAGLRVSARPYVLYHSAEEVRQPFESAALPLALLAIILALAGAVEARWSRSITRLAALGAPASIS